MRAFSTLCSTLFLCILLAFSFTDAAANPVRIMAVGDSLTQGYGLSPMEAYPRQLQEALRQRGYDVIIDNHGVSGDTTFSGLKRLPALLQQKEHPDLVLLALGANDMLRRRPVKETDKNLRAMLQLLQDNHIPVVLIGMKAVYHYSPIYKWRFNRLYPRLARSFDVPLVPFFLEGVAMNHALNQYDGLHPNALGVAKMVETTLPVITETLDRLAN